MEISTDNAAYSDLIKTLHMFPKRSAFVCRKFSKNFLECEKLRSRLIAEIFPISIRKLSAIVMSLKFRVSAYSQDRLIGK